MMRSEKGALTFGLSLTGICVSGMVYSFTFLSILSVCGKCLMVDCSSSVIDSSDDVTRRRMRHQMFLQVITPRKSLQRKEGTLYHKAFMYQMGSRFFTTALSICPTDHPDLRPSGKKLNDSMRPSIAGIIFHPRFLCNMFDWLMAWITLGVHLQTR